MIQITFVRIDAYITSSHRDIDTEHSTELTSTLDSYYQPQNVNHKLIAMISFEVRTESESTAARNFDSEK